MHIYTVSLINQHADKKNYYELLQLQHVIEWNIVTEEYQGEGEWKIVVNQHLHKGMNSDFGVTER